MLRYRVLYRAKVKVNEMKHTIFLILVFSCLIANATIYQYTDKHGNLSFSDTPSTNANITTLPKIDSYQTPKNKSTITDPKNNATATSRTKNHVVFDIQNLKNQQTFQNLRIIPVRIALEPILQKGDSVELWVDGKIYASGSVTDFILENLPRGTHTVQAKLLNNHGRIVKSTPLLTLYIKYHSILLPAKSTAVGNLPAQPVNPTIQALNPSILPISRKK